MKLFLAMLSLGYDALLMYQHYVLYADADALKQRQSGPQELDGVSLIPESGGRERVARSSDD